MMLNCKYDLKLEITFRSLSELHQGWIQDSLWGWATFQGATIYNFVEFSENWMKIKMDPRSSSGTGCGVGLRRSWPRFWMGHPRRIRDSCHIIKVNSLYILLCNRRRTLKLLYVLLFYLKHWPYWNFLLKKYPFSDVLRSSRKYSTHV